MDARTRKDFFVCLGIWLGLELICFGLLPLLGLALPPNEWGAWFIMSVLAGIGGACLLAGSTQVADGFRSQESTATLKLPQRLLVSLMSWLGLAGIAFPVFLISMQVFTLLLTPGNR